MSPPSGNLNDPLVGPDGLLTKLSRNDSMAVWANYFQVGGLWVSDPRCRAMARNQRGSLELTNTTLESTSRATSRRPAVVLPGPAP